MCLTTTVSVTDEISKTESTLNASLDKELPLKNVKYIFFYLNTIIQRSLIVSVATSSSDCNGDMCIQQ